MAEVCSDSESDKDSEQERASALERLQLYGDSWLDEESYQSYVNKARKKSKKSTSFLQFRESRNSDKDTGSVQAPASRRQKKKQRRKTKDASEYIKGTSSETDANLVKDKLPLKRTANRHLEELKSELELRSGADILKDKQKLEANKPQNSSGVMLNGSDDKVYVFEDPAKKKRKKVSVISPTNISTGNADLEADSAQPEINLRDARHDVKMFGIAGFQGDKKKTAITDMLIKLGAKPPKKSFHNYKEYMKIRKQEIGESKDRRQMERQFGLNNSKGDKKRGKRKDGIGYLDGQIGSYKSGVQILKKDDIHKVRKFKVKK